MARSKSSRRWLARQRSDDYVRRAKAAGYRSRAAFKLLEIQRRDRILRAGMTVVDLGAAPGGWSQVAADLVGREGTLFALDVLPMAPLPGVEFIHGDFREAGPLQQLEAALRGRQVDLVISDMAPNVSGMEAVDQPRAIYLGELAIAFAADHLVAGGALLVKVFQGRGFEDLVRRLRQGFDSVGVRKPDASRARSREVYILATGLRRRAVLGSEL